MFKCVTAATVPKIAESDSTIKKIFWDTNHDARFESMRKNTTSSHVLRRHEDLRKRCEKEVRTYERWQKLAAAELRLTQAKYQAKLRKIRTSLKTPPPYTPTDIHVLVNTKTEPLVRKIKAEAVPHYVRSRETRSSSIKNRRTSEITDEVPETLKSCSQSGTISTVKPSSDGKVSPKPGGFKYFRESTLSPRMESVVESLRLSLAYIPDTPSNVCYAIPKSDTGIQTPRASTPWGDQVFSSRSSTPRGDQTTFIPRASTPRGDRTFTPRASTPWGDQVFSSRSSTPRGDQVFSSRSSTPRGDQTFNPRESTPRDEQTPTPRPPTPRGDQEHKAWAPTPLDDQTLTPRVQTPRGNQTVIPGAQSPRIEVVGTTPSHKIKVNPQTRNSDVSSVSNGADVPKLDDLNGPKGQLLFSVRSENNTETYTRKQKIVTFKF